MSGTEDQVKVYSWLRLAMSNGQTLSFVACAMSSEAAINKVLAQAKFWHVQPDLEELSQRLRSDQPYILSPGDSLLFSE